MSAKKRCRTVLDMNDIESLLELSGDGDDISSDEMSVTSEESSDRYSSISESDNDEELIVSSDWTRNGNARPPFRFDGEAGIKFAIENKECPLQYFEKFFDDSLINNIVLETNRYAEQFLAANACNLSLRSRAKKWSETNAGEIKVYIGLLVLQGVNSKSENKMYFSKRESINSPFFAKVMIGRRFELIQKFLHFVDNDSIRNMTDSEGRKLAKIKPVIDYLLAKFMTNYVPERCISVDESLLGWKGRLSWLQFIPSRRKRFRMKFYELCESSSGYVWNFIIYTGKDTVYDEKYCNFPATARIVFSLSDSLLDKGYCLYLDNFYTGPILVDKLVERNTDCVGTVQLHRKEMPKFVKDAKLKENQLQHLEEKQWL